MKLILGILIGIILSLSIGTVYAENKTWNLTPKWSVDIERFQDGNVNCYVFKWGTQYGGISCVKVK